MSRMSRVIALFVSVLMLFSLTACSGGAQPAASQPDAAQPAGNAENKKIVMGFAQVGAESEWRTANTKNIQEEAVKAGIDLKFVDGQQKQEVQIKAIRSFIAQKVDVIAFSPKVETGWDTVLQEAKAAGIPVILTDRAIKTDDESLYVSFLGSDFVIEGERAAHWLLDNADTLGLKGDVNVFELQGTVGSAPAIDRKVGFEKVMKDHPNWKIVKSQTGDFTRAKGKEVMESWLKSDKDNIDVLYAHNDDMALGAIQAIEEAGLKPGEDIIIVSIDAVKGAFEAMISGKLNCSVECSPLLGAQLMQIAKDVLAGKSVAKRIVTDEGVFPAEVAAQELPNRQY